MDKNQFKTFVTDLVNSNGIAQEVIRREGDSWTVSQTFLGINAGTRYQSKDELIHALVDGGMAKYGQGAQLKTA